jgi:hypothetical protein
MKPLPDESMPETLTPIESKEESRGLGLADSIVEPVYPALHNTEAGIGSQREFKNLSDLLMNSPFAGSDLDLERVQDYGRPIDIA